VPSTFATVLLTVGAMFSLPAPGIGQDHAVQKTVIGLEYKWAEAQRDANPGVVAPLLAESFVNTDADGQVYGKAQLLSNLKGGKWEQNGISDVKVAVYGDTAVATGAWAGKGVDGDGTRINRRERWTDTWARNGKGKWQCVASQQTSTKTPAVRQTQGRCGQRFGLAFSKARRTTSAVSWAKGSFAASDGVNQCTSSASPEARASPSTRRQRKSTST
jgi:ketosteroid isomerase-like protein